MTQIKICGLTNIEDVRAAIKAGADMLGFIFYPKSPRYINPGQVDTILSQLDFGGRQIMKIGVFVNEAPDVIVSILDKCNLDAAQLHGEEPPEHMGITEESILKGRVYKAIRPNTEHALKMMAEAYALPAHLRKSGLLPSFLVDSYHPNLRGGTGETGDWNQAARTAHQYPILLAGGLKPDNVDLAVKQIKPWGVDVSSGIEKFPGKKDLGSMVKFIQAVRSIKVHDEEQ